MITLAKVCALALICLISGSAHAAPKNKHHEQEAGFRCFRYENGEYGCVIGNESVGVQPRQKVEREFTAEYVEDILLEAQEELRKKGDKEVVVKPDGRISAKEAINFISIMQTPKDEPRPKECIQERTA